MLSSSDAHLFKQVSIFFCSNKIGAFFSNNIAFVQVRAYRASAIQGGRISVRIGGLTGVWPPDGKGNKHYFCCLNFVTRWICCRDAIAATTGKRASVNVCFGCLVLFGCGDGARQSSHVSHHIATVSTMFFKKSIESHCATVRKLKWLVLCCWLVIGVMEAVIQHTQAVPVCLRKATRWFDRHGDRHWPVAIFFVFVRFSHASGCLAARPPPSHAMPPFATTSFSVQALSDELTVTSETRKCYVLNTLRSFGC